MSELLIEEKREGTTAVLLLKGEARLEEISRLYDAARRHRKDGAKRLLLGLSGLDFMDSASIGAFLELEKEYAGAGGGIVLFSCPKRLSKILEGMGLKNRFKIAADEASARATV